MCGVAVASVAQLPSFGFTNTPRRLIRLLTPAPQDDLLFYHFNSLPEHIAIAALSAQFSRAMFEYELRLPANGAMVKIATLKPSTAHGFPDRDLPRRFLDVGTDFKKGRDMQQAIRTSMPLEFICKDPSEVRGNV